MYKFIKLFIIITCVCIGLTACGGAVSGMEGKTVIVTPAIKGNSASLNIGDTLEVRIPTIPTTGYEWAAQYLDKAILIQDGSAVFVEDSSPSSAGGIVTLTFTAVGAGKTTINLLYVGPSSNETPSMSSNSLSVTVEVK
jgi:predicted secreted protein